MKKKININELLYNEQFKIRKLASLFILSIYQATRFQVSRKFHHNLQHFTNLFVNLKKYFLK